MVSRRKSRWPVALTIVGALIALAAGFAFVFWPQIFALIEDEMIYRTKANHWRLASSGNTLPGTPDLKNFSARLQAQKLQLGAPVLCASSSASSSSSFG
jgi:hypothetical protein